MNKNEFVKTNKKTVLVLRHYDSANYLKSLADLPTPFFSSLPPSLPPHCTIKRVRTTVVGAALSSFQHYSAFRTEFLGTAWLIVVRLTIPRRVLHTGKRRAVSVSLAHTHAHESICTPSRESAYRSKCVYDCERRLGLCQCQKLLL